MIDDLNAYKVSATQLAELDHCKMSLLYYMLTETESTEIARGLDFAQIEAEFWKTLEPADLLQFQWDTSLPIEDQPIIEFLYNLIEWDLDDTFLNRMFWQFCKYQAERFAGMKRDEDYLLDFFLPYEVEFEIEGTDLVGRPDTIFRIPLTKDRFYIQDTKTSLDSPTWLNRKVNPPEVKKTSSYYRTYRQIHVYHIIKQQHGIKTDYGNILHICPYRYSTASFKWQTITINTILNKKIPALRNCLRIMRDTVTDLENTSQIRSLKEKLQIKDNPSRCMRCSRNAYCAAACA